MELSFDLTDKKQARKIINHSVSKTARIYLSKEMLSRMGLFYGDTAVIMEAKIHEGNKIKRCLVLIKE